MIRYHSNNKTLEFTKKFILSDGKTPMMASGTLDLSAVSEPERQRLIAIAKLTTSWASGHDIQQGQTVKKDEGDIVIPSLLAKAESIIARAKASADDDIAVVSDIDSV